jgi:hypothetical protein
MAENTRVYAHVCGFAPVATNRANGGLGHCSATAGLGPWGVGDHRG